MEVRASVAMSMALHAILVVAVVRTWPDARSAPPSAPPAFVDDAPVENRANAAAGVC